jgi:hypothetical protein
MDLVIAVLAVLLGAMIAYLADELLPFTSRLATWLQRVFGEE